MPSYSKTVSTTIWTYLESKTNRVREKKSYIKTNLANSFIWLSKSSAKAHIFFDWKPDASFYLYVDYQNFNNLTIKNWYPLFLINIS